MIDYTTIRSKLPENPGVYIFKHGDVYLYIGKAKNLKKRVASYFTAHGEERRQIPRMLEKAQDIDWIITENESEALVLEANLVREHSPKYNIELRDDKQYPYVKITMNEVFPRIRIVRRIEKDRCIYFGPFTDATRIRRIVTILRKLFKIRTCSRRISANDTQRPCLNYAIGICSGPCNSHVSTEEYAKNISAVIDFFRGKRQKIVQTLNAEMCRAAENLSYEKAALLRDRIRDVKKIGLRQGVDLRNPELNCDVFAVYVGEKYMALSVMVVREGVIINQNNHAFRRQEWQYDDHGMLVVDYYTKSAHEPPREVILSEDFTPDSELLHHWLREQWNIAVRIPQRGDKKALLDRCRKAAGLYLSQRFLTDFEAIHTELSYLMNLPRVPHTIEAFDISNLGSQFTVAGMVHYEGGYPVKSEYRRYKIKTVAGQDDFAMLMEAVTRRLRRLEREEKTFPDLLLIDGGKGQLSGVCRALSAFESPPMVISLAKKEEILYSPYTQEGVRLREGHSVRRLVERIRDEVHRFAITYHRKIRGRNFNRSLLEDVPGIGSKMSRLLLRKFGSAENIARRSAEELAQIPGITIKKAEALLEELRQFY
jgi:excinuclease ABC subunit C